MLSKEVKKRFSVHRGLYNSLEDQNSIMAIKKGIEESPPLLEFDVVYYEGGFWTAHPPQDPLDDLGEVLDLFKGKKTYIIAALVFLPALFEFIIAGSFSLSSLLGFIESEQFVILAATIRNGIG